MDKTEQAIRRAEQAQQVLNNPLFDAAFKDTEAGIVEAWKKLNPSEARVSEYAADLHRMTRCLERVRKCLVEHITTGKLAQENLKSKRNLFGKKVGIDN